MDKVDDDYRDMRDYLSLQSDAVKRNCRIVTPDMMHSEFALHIDKNTPKVFIPRMPHSAMSSENDSCPRVTVASTLLGCYIGYFRGEADIARGSVVRPKDKDPYHGGYAINKLHYTHALLPSPRLVSDSERSEELWLVPFNVEHTKFVPEEIGKIFVSQVTYIPVTGKEPELMITMFIYHNEPIGIWLNKEIMLEAGYHKVDVHWPNIYDRDINSENAVTSTVVDSQDYDAAKSRVAAFLSRDSDRLPYRPVFFSWQ